MDEIEVQTECEECGNAWTQNEQTDEVPLPIDVALSLYRQGLINTNEMETYTLKDLYRLIIDIETRAAA